MSHRVSYRQYNAEELRGKGLIVTEHIDLGLAIVRYHKSDNEWKKRTFGECDRMDDTVRKHRSVVYSLTTGMPLSVSPHRRISHEDIGSGSFNDSWVVSEYYDGTMINVFWNPAVNPDTHESFGWTLSSRSKIHAMCRFTSDHLFRDLFESARVMSGVEYSSLDKGLCYTFILVHPESRRVIKYDSPRIILVSAVMCVPYIADITDMPTLYAKSLPWDELVTEGRRIGGDAILPRRLEIPAEHALSWALDEANSGNLCGLIVSNGWNRVRILTDAFEKCAKLRGDSASRKTNHIRLMSIDPRGDAIRQYAEWYPEESDDIRKLGEEIKETIKDLLENYIDRHVKKTKEHTDLPHWSRRPIWDLHGRYLRTKQVIREKDVFVYFRNLSPSTLAKVLKTREKENKKDSERIRQNVHEELVAEAAPAAAAEAAEAPSSER